METDEFSTSDSGDEAEAREEERERRAPPSVEQDQVEQREPEPEQEDTGPIGAGDHEVQEGECILSIAEAAGLFWETVWNHPDNADLKRERGSPHLLRPGDRLTVPELTKKSESCAAEDKHRFRRKGVPAILRFQVLDVEKKPRKNLDYVIHIDGEQRKGKTDRDGCLKESIPPGAQEAVLEFEEEGAPVEYRFSLGHLYPVSELKGVQQRLQNLGYYAGEIDGEASDTLRAAVVAFQSSAELEPTGTADDQTREKLEAVHGC